MTCVAVNKIKILFYFIFIDRRKGNCRYTAIPSCKADRSSNTPSCSMLRKVSERLWIHENHIFELWLINEDESDLRCNNKHYFSSSENEV